MNNVSKSNRSRTGTGHKLPITFVNTYIDRRTGDVSGSPVTATCDYKSKKNNTLLFAQPGWAVAIECRRLSQRTPHHEPTLAPRFLTAREALYHARRNMGQSQDDWEVLWCHPGFYLTAERFVPWHANCLQVKYHSRLNTSHHRRQYTLIVGTEASTLHPYTQAAKPPSPLVSDATGRPVSTATRPSCDGEGARPRSGAHNSRYSRRRQRAAPDQSGRHGWAPTRST
jgi:hypothetical protein